MLGILTANIIKKEDVFMNTLVIVLIAVVVLGLGYVLYGRHIAKKWGIDPKAETPAVKYNDGFNNWVKQVFALCLTAFLQTTLLFLGLLSWSTNMLLAIGIMMSAAEVPRIAQQFGLDTSVKVNVMSAVHMGTSAVNLVKAAGK